MDIIILVLAVLIGSVLSQSSRGISGSCQDGAPLSNFNCGRGGQRCPSGYSCEIAPNDAYAVCCRTSGYRLCPPPTGPGVCASSCQQGRFDHCRRSGRLCCRNGCGAYQCTRPRRPSPGIPHQPTHASRRVRGPSILGADDVFRTGCATVEEADKMMWMFKTSIIIMSRDM